MLNIIPSSEQKIIIDSFKDGNLIVNCVIGGGKTTIALLIAKQYPEENILLITYNKRLRLDTKERAIYFSLKNLEVHSFHSFCYNYYSVITFV